jgi:hypothetical protein
MTWLPDDFDHPHRVELPTGHHLRPIRADDVDVDYPAVMSSRDRLWSIYGDASGWPPVTMTVEQDRADLARHEAEANDHESFNYAVFDAAETVLLGCVYVDPPTRSGADAEISWVGDRRYGWDSARRCAGRLRSCVDRRDVAVPATTPRSSGFVNRRRPDQATRQPASS